MLADDDEDDCFLFKDALEQLALSVSLTTVKNGEALMQLLNEKNGRLPDVLFLDLNMPRKNGIDCLLEIKSNENLKQFPVVIFSTSLSPEVVGQVYKNGAHYYIRKPNEFGQLKKLIYKALTLTAQAGNIQPPIEKFVLPPETFYNENK